MSSTVNHALIESLALTAQGRKPLFCWEQVPFGVHPAAEGLAEGRLVLPALAGTEKQHELLSRTGFALVMASLESGMDPTAWPSNGKARMATAAMEIGAAASRRVQELFFHEPHVVTFLQELETRLQILRETGDPLRGAEGVASLFFAASARSALTNAGRIEGELLSVLNAILDGFACDAELGELAEHVGLEIPHCRCSADYARLASSLWPDSAEEAPIKKEASNQSQPPGSCGGQMSPASEQRAQDGAEGEQELASKGAAGTATGGQPGEGSSAADDAKSDASEPAKDELHEVGEDLANQADHGSAMGAVDEITDESEAAQIDSSHAPDVEEVPSHSVSANSVGSDEIIAAVPVEDEGPAGDPTLLTLAISGLAGGSGFAGEAAGQQDLVYATDGRLIASLMRVFQEQRRAPVALAAAGARVATPHFWRLRALGDVRVFQTPSLVSGVDVGVQILLDRSGSMRHILQEASRISLALGDALRRVTGIRSALAVFPGPCSVVQPLLDFGGQLSAARSALRGLKADGGTPLGGAMQDLLPGLDALATRQKFLIVIGDGRPGDHALTQSMLVKYRERGIEVLGVGIGEESRDLKLYIPRCAIVDDMRGLPPALEDLFKAHVLKKAA